MAVELLGEVEEKLLFAHSGKGIVAVDQLVKPTVLCVLEVLRHG